MSDGAQANAFSLATTIRFSLNEDVNNVFPPAFLVLCQNAAALFNCEAPEISHRKKHS